MNCAVTETIKISMGKANNIVLSGQPFLTNSPIQFIQEYISPKWGVGLVFIEFQPLSCFLLMSRLQLAN